MHAAVRRTVLVLALLAAAPLALGGAQGARAQTFASEIERLSEPEGAFDTDNLISNERMYLKVIPALVARGVSGGAYIGVGPDQNFSYIARIRPTVAYIIDVRRDNLLLHLLFKALFARSRTRVDYLSQLVGRPPPPDLDPWRTASIGQIVAEVDQQASSPAAVDKLRRQLDQTVAGFGVHLSTTDLRAIDRFHRAFIEDGLDLQFHTFGRPPQPYYPKLRDLLLATDAAGHTWNYLASEDDFQFVKALQGRDAVIPVVGNVAGPHAMRTMAETLAARGTDVSAFYVSNIEAYLFGRDGSFLRFAENVGRLPRNQHSVIIRSIFGSGGSSTSEIESIDALNASPDRNRPR